MTICTVRYGVSRSRVPRGTGPMLAGMRLRWTSRGVCRSGYPGPSRRLSNLLRRAFMRLSPSGVAGGSVAGGVADSVWWPSVPTRMRVRMTPITNPERPAATLGGEGTYRMLSADQDLRLYRKMEEATLTVLRCDLILTVEDIRFLPLLAADIR